MKGLIVTEFVWTKKPHVEASGLSPLRNKKCALAAQLGLAAEDLGRGRTRT